MGTCSQMQRKRNFQLVAEADKTVSIVILKDCLQRYRNPLDSYPISENMDDLLNYFKKENVLLDTNCPTEPWDVIYPLPSYTKLGDDIKRLAIIHKSVGEAQTSRSIPETEFKELWLLLENVASRMDTRFNKKRLFTARLEKIKHKKFGSTRGKKRSKSEPRCESPRILKDSVPENKGTVTLDNMK